MKGRSSMSSYKLDKKLTSLSISLNTLREIEKYLREQGEKQKVEQSRLNYKAVIYDKWGEEDIGDFENYNRSTLHNGTTRIILKIVDYHTAFMISVSFGENDDIYTRMNIEVTNGSAKELATGIATRIENMLTEYRNCNYLFHIFSFQFIPMLVPPVILLFILSFFKAFPITMTYISGFLLFLLFLLIALSTVSPYTTFDTNINQKLQGRKQWILGGMTGFFLFSVVFEYLRKKFLGF